MEVKGKFLCTSVVETEETYVCRLSLRVESEVLFVADVKVVLQKSAHPECPYKQGKLYEGSVKV